ncbi:hypothetical protein HMI56_000463 [Coelomomyces lativittatus]|nr:hypothetical protein HMI56_000463 [Coelomomyces lativittatus]
MTAVGGICNSVLTLANMYCRNNCLSSLFCTSKLDTYIDQARRKGKASVSEICISATLREQQRRKDELKKKAILQAKHLDCDKQTQLLEAQIQAQWETCFKTNSKLGNPYDLHQLLLNQKNVCDQLILSKDRLIIEYNAELKRKDDDYVKELKREAEEIDQLLVRMYTEYATFKKSLKENLIQIERSLMDERAENLDQNIKEMDGLFDSRKESEIKYLNERRNRVHDNGEALEELRVQDAEECNLVKIKLETDVQVLEQQLQQMKATYQLNTEKLEYNYQVLKKRDDENSITVNQQKRRITRMTDILNALKMKHAKHEKAFHVDHTNLQEDFNRISSQYQDLTKKFKHFQINDEIKFNELWEMHQKHLQLLITKVVQADAVIYEKELGVCHHDTRTHDASTSPSHGWVGGGGGGGGGGGTHATPSSKDLTPDPLKWALMHAQHPMVQTILHVVSKEAHFLLDEKLVRLLQPLPYQEQRLLKLDTILKALDIHSSVDLEAFLNLFVDSSTHVSLQQWTTTQLTLVPLNQVNSLIHAWLKRKREKQEDPTHPDGGAGVGVKKTTPPTSHLTSTMGVGHGKKGFKAHWEEIMKVVDERHVKACKRVLTHMEAFHQLLVQRKTYIDEVCPMDH